MDIKIILKRGQYIRIGKCFFVVMKIEGKSVTFNRRWRFKNKKNAVMYLMPCYPGELYKSYYKARILLFDQVTGNSLSQIAINWYYRSMEFMAARSRKMATSNKRMGLMVTAKKWTKAADKYENNAMWADNMIYIDGVTDLISIDGTVESGDHVQMLRKKVRPEDRVAGELWEATEAEKEARADREKFMSRAQLGAEADDWEERFDALNNKPYYVNIKTTEMMSEVPKAITTKQELDEEAAQKRKDFEEMQKKLADKNKKKKR
jgi:hypothetical protein